MPIVQAWSAAGPLSKFDLEKKVRLQAIFPEPKYYTAQFSLRADPSLPRPLCVADITWSVAGNAITRRISVVDGASISGTAEGVLIVISDDTRGGGGANYEAAVLVTPGVRASKSQPPVFFPSLLGVGNGLWPIQVGAASEVSIVFPRDVGIVSVQGSASNQGTPYLPVVGDCIMSIQAVSGPSLPLAAYDLMIHSGFVPVSPNGGKIVLSNTSASTKNFTLQFGIDG